jgi:hypothetical protein
MFDSPEKPKRISSIFRSRTTGCFDLESVSETRAKERTKKLKKGTTVGALARPSQPKGWQLLRTRFAGKPDRVTHEELANAVHHQLAELLELCYCELIVLTPVPAELASAEARKYLEYIHRVNIVSAHGGTEAETARVLDSIVAMPSEPTPSSTCVRTQEPVLVSNALTDKRFDVEQQRRLEMTAISQLHVPLLARRKARRYNETRGTRSSEHSKNLEKKMGIGQKQQELMVVGVLSLVNKVDESGRAGVAFDEPTDAQRARAVAAAIVELRERVQKANILKTLLSVDKKDAKAAVKVQAVFRGRNARRLVATIYTGRLAVTVSKASKPSKASKDEQRSERSALRWCHATKTTSAVSDELEDALASWLMGNERRVQAPLEHVASARVQRHARPSVEM